MRGEAVKEELQSLRRNIVSSPPLLTLRIFVLLFILFLKGFSNTAASHEAPLSFFSVPALHFPLYFKTFLSLSFPPLYYSPLRLSENGETEVSGMKAKQKMEGRLFPASGDSLAPFYGGLVYYTHYTFPFCRGGKNNNNFERTADLPRY